MRWCRSALGVKMRNIFSSLREEFFGSCTLVPGLCPGTPCRAGSACLRPLLQRQSRSALAFPGGAWEREGPKHKSGESRHEKTLSFVGLLCIQTDQPSDKNREVHLPAHRFEDRQSPCRIARRDDIAVAERRNRHEAEIDGMRQIEIACRCHPKRCGPGLVEQPVANGENQTSQQIGVQSRKDMLGVYNPGSQRIARRGCRRQQASQYPQNLAYR